MHKNEINIIFFGSDEFALPVARGINERFPLSGLVVTQPRPRGRGQLTQQTEIALWAQNIGITVYSPSNPNDEEFISLISKLKPDLFVLASYRHILSEQLLRVPALGGINIHPSLLPQYRGAAPIQRAIMAGENKTGITIIFMDARVDHGEMIYQEEISIETDENYGSLKQRLSKLAARAISSVIDSVVTGTCKKVRQNHDHRSYAPKLKKEDAVIAWHDSSRKIHNLIRALSPKPGAQTVFRGQRLFILSSKISNRKFKPGSIHVENKTLYVGTGNGSLILGELKPQNKGNISGADFINGYRITEGETLG
jgi:methionyl-tRNA formyltransferase